ncbi:MAG: nicotinate phosphoribosyltransferase [Blastocatellia bacterium]|nr:nicotinate phosphoribosyltransferase [Blastocatellia bacterium]
MNEQGFNESLMTDLYQLTMAAGYLKEGLNQRATFELFTSRLPTDRGYLIVAGVEQALDYLKELHFEKEDIDYLRSLKPFQSVGEEFFDYLYGFHFTGDVWAMPEGTLVFPDEPIMRIEAPLIEAQIVETYLLSVINFQTMIATKASRVCSAARQDGKERAVLEFGTRRAHGPVAGTLAARASYLGGCTGTSNLAAGKRFSIPVYGTAAHAWILAHDSEIEAFKNYFALYPETCTLLIDTYDTFAGAVNATKIGRDVLGVRIDSGDLAESSRKVRKILDDAEMTDTKIILSGDLNEYSISEMISSGVPVDSFGVGTDLSTSRDAPSLGVVYKLVERVDRNGKKHYSAKFSTNKITLPGAKQVFRHISNDGIYRNDTIGLAEEACPEDAVRLLIEVMKDGKVLLKSNIEDARARASSELSKLDARYKLLKSPDKYRVGISDELAKLLESVKESMHR